MKFQRYFSAILLVAITWGSASSAQDPTLGPVTNLPLPRFVSLKAAEANIRRGPSTTHRIDWVLMRRGTPLQITAEFEHWRRVRDEDGAGGWIHYSLISGGRTVVIQKQRIALHKEPNETSATTALAEKGVVATLGRCEREWCEIDSSGYRGWVEKSGIWGVGAAELRE